MNKTRWIAVALFATALAACGGGGGSPGKPNGSSAGSTSGSGSGTGSASGSGGTTATPTANVANFIMLLDRSTLQDTGSATAKLTVLAVDANNNIVPGATVSVATDANSIFTPTGSAVTDATGLYTGTISYGADQSSRTVTITATVNNIVKKTTLQVTGATLTVATTPSVPTLGASTVLTATLTDSASVPIANTTLTFSGDIPALAGQSAQTDSNGKVTVPFTAPATAGAYIVNVSGAGATASVSVQVGAGASIPAATIPAGVAPGLQALPNIVAPNAGGSTSNQSQLRFLIVDSTNTPIPNVRVRFAITSTGLGSTGSSISTAGSVVYTDASGVASAAFIPGSAGSPTDGVTVQACYSGSDFAAGTCPNQVQVSLTVAQQGLAISIGDDNLLQKANGQYTKQFSVTVADAAGRPVSGAAVDISVDLPYFGKGAYAQAITFPGVIQPIGLNKDVPTDPTITPAANGARVSCINQDLNRNGLVDPGEGTNPPTTDGFGQTVLLPRKSDLTINYVNPAVTKTDANGLLLIQVTYSMNFATWLEYHVRASTSVTGSQGTAERAFITTFQKGDDTNGGSFLTPPYGTGACNTPN